MEDTYLDIEQPEVDYVRRREYSQHGNAPSPRPNSHFPFHIREYTGSHQLGNDSLSAVFGKVAMHIRTLPKAFEINSPPYRIAERKASSYGENVYSSVLSDMSQPSESYPTGIPARKQVDGTGIERGFGEADEDTSCQEACIALRLLHGHLVP